MRILLVRPDSTMKSTFLPLGIGYIADAARKAGHEVSVLDARLLRLEPKEVLAHIKNVSPDVVGLSALHFEKQETRQLASVLRQDGNRFKLVLGGPLVSTSGDEFVNERLVDVAVKGEGEIAFNAYLEALGKGGSLDDVPGITYLKDGQVNENSSAGFVDDLDDRTPAWDLIGLEKYQGFLSRSRMGILHGSERGATIFTSRGCPYGCIYCHNMFGKKFRPRSAEAVLEEIYMLKKQYKIKELEIVDDVFNLDLERAKRIAQGIIDNNLSLDISFPNGLRADRMDEELIDLLKNAGTYRINYAVETASPRLQKLIKKNLDLDRTRQVIDYTSKKGILTFGFFMLGFPTETEDEMRLTVDYALKSSFHTAYFFYVNPFPGTELAAKYLPESSTVDETDEMAYFDLKVNLSEVPDSTLRKINKDAYKNFYFSPRRMWRTFRVVPKNLRTAWSVAVIALLSLRDWRNW